MGDRGSPLTEGGEELLYRLKKKLTDPVSEIGITIMTLP